MRRCALNALPVELHQQIVDFLDRDSQNFYSLTYKRAWDVVTNAIWRDVKLIDQRSRHQVPEELKKPSVEGGKPFNGRDEHDDTPIIRKLLVLAT